jgi:hypothetical protein
MVISSLAPPFVTSEPDASGTEAKLAVMCFEVH